MDALSSTEFRKRFATLTEPTTVTVNGHVIGEWVPVHHARYQTVQEVKAMIAEVQADARAVVEETRAEPVTYHALGRWPITTGFNSAPFTPVPKRGK